MWKTALFVFLAFSLLQPGRAQDDDEPASADRLKPNTFLAKVFKTGKKIRDALGVSREDLIKAADNLGINKETRGRIRDVR